MTALKGWLGNKADSPTTIEVNEALAREFMASEQYDAEGQLRRPLVFWLASHDGKNLAWENDQANLEAIDDLVDLIRAAEKAGKGQ